jgi:quercetin dioxygenase-like cupin family protein
MQGSISGKVWGTTQRVFETSNVSVEVVKIAAGGYCSRHRHLRRDNLFHVLEGHLRVKTRKDGLEDEIVLRPGESTLVKAGDVHWFEALTDVVALEVYHARVEADDIVRETQGGRLPPTVSRNDRA